MKIRELLEDHNMKMSITLAEIMVYAVKEVMPHLYEGYRARGWSNWSLVYFVHELEDRKSVV